MIQTVKKRGKTNNINRITMEACPSVNEVIISPDSLPSNLILHLKKLNLDNIDTEYLKSETILEYNPTLTTPDAYDPIDNCKYRYLSETSCKTEKHIDKKTENTICTSEIEKLCWWCCHSYNNETICLPIRKKCGEKGENSYECVGTFCSPECTCAYILDSGSRYGDKWAEYELLHEMLNQTEKIKPAPKRELLRVFGGELTIADFRSNNKQYNMVYPPMVTLKMQMDDTPYDSNISNDESKFLNSSTLKLGSLNLDNIEGSIPDKVSSKKKNGNKTIGNLDRFWGNIIES